MTIDPTLIQRAQEEFHVLLRVGVINLRPTTEFTPKAGTDVIHYDWYSSNGLKARVVETHHPQSLPSYSITEWREVQDTEVKQDPKTNKLTLQSVLAFGRSLRNS